MSAVVTTTESKVRETQQTPPMPFVWTDPSAGASAGNTRERAALTAPPAWAVRAVKVCVTGILVLPLGTPVLLTASSIFGEAADPFRFPAFVVSVVLWAAMLVSAMWITSTYPPVQHR